jgi:hypothetical protein
MTYTGSVIGPPVQRGSLMLVTHLVNGGVAATYRLTGQDGGLAGVVRAALRPGSGQATYSGTVTPRSGTGRFAHVKPLPLRLSGSGSLNSLTFEVTGTLRF